MSSVLIPKEELTAFQRWELASFDHPSKGGLGVHGKIELATVAELEQIRQQAYDEGYAQGHDAGYAAGAQQIRTEIGQVQAVMQQLQTELNQIDVQLAQSLLNLSLEIARKMVGQTLQVNPEVILGIVNEAIGSLPHFNQHAHLVLHPEDVELVRKHMGDQLSQTGWKLLSDPRIERGGCRVETAHTKVDATVEARWKRIVESIGQDKSWLA
ncbi:MAG: flagellar assembly protein FliH [Gallionella sp.]|jgi:flagellar assembly protein FliH|nr:flagellar assembly protein FliH [Gallionella sp.]MCK9354958.1 flagellar assembly protein FliH [Gallionella sp.]